MPNTQNTITLAGRKFAGPGHDLTAAQDLYIMARLRLADAFPIIQRVTPENFERCHQELLTNIMLRGLTFDLLGGLLTESGKTWSQAEADRNAQTFAGVTDAGEKLAIQAQVVDFVLGFMEPARPSSKSSPSSSTAAAGRPTASAAPASSASLP